MRNKYLTLAVLTLGLVVNNAVASQTYLDEIQNKDTIILATRIYVDNFEKIVQAFPDIKNSGGYGVISKRSRDVLEQGVSALEEINKIEKFLPHITQLLHNSNNDLLTYARLVDQSQSITTTAKQAIDNELFKKATHQFIEQIFCGYYTIDNQTPRLAEQKIYDVKLFKRGMAVYQSLYKQKFEVERPEWPGYSIGEALWQYVYRVNGDRQREEEYFQNIDEHVKF